MRMGGGWEEAGTLAPRAATVLWELAHKFPKFSHINFRTSLQNPRSLGDNLAPVQAALRKGTARGRGCLAWPPGPARPRPWEGHERHEPGTSPVQGVGPGNGPEGPRA